MRSPPIGRTLKISTRNRLQPNGTIDYFRRRGPQPIVWVYDIDAILYPVLFEAIREGALSAAPSPADPASPRRRRAPRAKMPRDRARQTPFMRHMRRFARAAPAAASGGRYDPRRPRLGVRRALAKPAWAVIRGRNAGVGLWSGVVHSAADAHARVRGIPRGLASYVVQAEGADAARAIVDSETRGARVGPRGGVGAAVDGVQVVVYTDGSCRELGKGALRGFKGVWGRVAGFGVWFGEGDPFNISSGLPGEVQTSTRAELAGVVCALEIIVREGLEAVASTCVGGVGRIIIRLDACLTQRRYGRKNNDLWMRKEDAEDTLRRRGAEVSIEWVKGHADSYGNFKSDELAGMGSFAKAREVFRRATLAKATLAASREGRWMLPQLSTPVSLRMTAKSFGRSVFNPYATAARIARENRPPPLVRLDEDEDASPDVPTWYDCSVVLFDEELDFVKGASPGSPGIAAVWGQQGASIRDEVLPSGNSGSDDDESNYLDCNDTEIESPIFEEALPYGSSATYDDAVIYVDSADIENESSVSGLGCAGQISTSDVVEIINLANTNCPPDVISLEPTTGEDPSPKISDTSSLVADGFIDLTLGD